MICRFLQICAEMKLIKWDDPQAKALSNLDQLMDIVLSDIKEKSGERYLMIHFMKNMM